MNNPLMMKDWKVLCWNIRGINAVGKWESLKNKIIECQCDIISIQETKRESFDLSYIKNFCPGGFDDFCFLPSIGSSGGILVVWKSAIFRGTVIFQNDFAISVDFISVHNNDSWILTSVYGPSETDRKVDFLNWLW
jgi:exonuclease III